MRLKNLDLITGILFVILNVGWTYLPIHPLVVGIILALPLVFVLPGYALTQVLFQRPAPDLSGELILRPRLKIGQPVGAVDYIILTLGLSLALDVLVGFLLNLFPIGLRLQSWAISLGLVTTLCILLAGYLRRKNLIKIGREPKLRITIHDCMLFGLAILVATVAVWYSVVRPPQPQPSFTQFWMLPSKQAKSSCTILIGVRSYEATSVTYRIVLMVNATQINTWSSVVLAPQAEWDRSVSIKPEAVPSLHMEALLYRADKPKILYREVHMTLNSPIKESQQQQCTS